MDLTVPAEAAGQRLDRFLADQLADYSRSRIQAWIRDGRVLVDDITARPATKLAGGEILDIDPAPLEPLKAFPEDLPLAILHEDDDLVVVNKAAGMTVHVGAGEASQKGTLVNALLHRFGRLSNLGGDLRPGIVHRLDRFTSGVIVVAKTERAHRALADSFAERKVHKTYEALVHGDATSFRKGRRVEGWTRFEAPIGRGRRHRTHMAVVTSGRHAVTDCRLITTSAKYSRVEIKIHTGRTHQIRVHLAWAGHPVVGDRLYGAPAFEESDRFYLHARRLEFEHPTTAEPICVEAPPLADFEEVAKALGV